METQRNMNSKKKGMNQFQENPNYQYTQTNLTIMISFVSETT